MPRPSLTIIALACAIVASSVTPGVANPSSAAPWPISAQGKGLPRPDWVMVIPARRTPDGRLVIWDRTDEWTKAWRAPRVMDGIRIVTLFGDAEDRRSITADAIDGMLVDQMAVVLRKYRAPALALAVTDGDSTVVAAYMPGWSASWDAVSRSSGDLRADAGRTLVSLFSSGRGAAASSQPSAVQPIDVEIEAYRDNMTTGGRDYRIVVQGEGADLALSRISASTGAAIVSVAPIDDLSLRAVVSVSRGQSLEQAMRSLGYEVR